MTQDVCVQVGMTEALQQTSYIYFIIFLPCFFFCFFFCCFVFFFLMINKENNPKGQSVEEVVKLRLCSSDIQLARSERQPFPYVPDKSWDP